MLSSIFSGDTRSAPRQSSQNNPPQSVFSRSNVKTPQNYGSANSQNSRSTNSSSQITFANKLGAYLLNKIDTNHQDQYDIACSVKPLISSNISEVDFKRMISLCIKDLTTFMTNICAENTEECSRKKLDIAFKCSNLISERICDTIVDSYRENKHGQIVLAQISKPK